jgi:hypothetical protein
MSSDFFSPFSGRYVVEGYGERFASGYMSIAPIARTSIEILV